MTCGFFYVLSMTKSLMNVIIKKDALNPDRKQSSELKRIV